MKSLIGKVKAVHGGQGGFTLIEMMVVLAIMAIIVGLVVPNMFGVIGEAESTEIQGQHEKMREAVFSYYADTSEFPTEWSGYVVGNAAHHQLWHKDGVNGWDGPYLDRPILQENRWGGEWGVTENPDLVDTGAGQVYKCALEYNNVPLEVCEEVDAAMDDGNKNSGAVQYSGGGDSYELEIGIALE